jgi:WD40 repeat protein
MKIKVVILYILILFAFVSACSGSQESSPSQPFEAAETTPTSPVTTPPLPGTPIMAPENPLSQNLIEMVTFTTIDGITLAGTLFGKGDTAVILAHQGTPGADQRTWHPFANLLAEHGYTALTFDFRGVGQSEGKLLYGNLAMDVSAAVQLLQNRGYQKIICIGASMGGTACIRAAQDHAFVGLVALASTMTAGSGTDSLRLTPDDLKNLTQPKLFISANGDHGVVVGDTKRMYELSPNPKNLLLLPGTQHGTNLFDTDAGEKLSAAMLRFIENIDNQASEALPALQPITIENADKTQLLRTMESPGYKRGQISQCSLDFSPDGHLLVGACGKNQVPVWDVQSGKIRQLLSDPSTQIVTCTFSPDGKIIACGGFDNTITFWDSETGQKLSDFGSHTSPVWDIAFSPDGKKMVSCSLQDDVRLWDVEKGVMIWSYEGENGYLSGYLSVAYSPSGDKIAYGNRRGAYVGMIDVLSGQSLIELDEPLNAIGDVAFSPSGAYLAAGTDDYTIYIWDTANYQLAMNLKGHRNYVNGVSFNPDGSLLVSGSKDKTLGLWDLAEQKLLTTLTGHKDAILRVAVSPDGTLIASISWDGTVRLWGVVQD